MPSSPAPQVQAAPQVPSSPKLLEPSQTSPGSISDGSKIPSNDVPLQLTHSLSAESSVASKGTSSKTTIRKEDYISIPEKADPVARNARTYFSFGEEGVTASVNSKGDLIQVTRFLGTGRSGLFSVDSWATDEPFFVVDRMEQLVNYVSIGPYLEDSIDAFRDLVASNISSGFIRDRWPHFTAETEKLALESSFFVHNNGVYIQDTYTSNGDTFQMPWDLKFDSDISIRELDFLNTSHKFNEATVHDKEYKTYVGPDNDLIIFAHAGSGEENILGTIVLTIVFFMNGEPLDIEQEGRVSGELSSFRIKLRDKNYQLEPGTPLEFVTAYKLQFIQDDTRTVADLVSIPPFTFQFLVAMFEHLKPQESNSHSGVREMAKTTRQRIRDTCAAHLEWLIERVKPETIFAANYWVTGREILNPESVEVLAATSLTDTPFHIIKVADFASRFKEDDDVVTVKAATRMLKIVAREWIEELRKEDKRQLTAFPRPGTQKYRLDDHVWIWRALQSLKDLDIDGELETTQQMNKTKRKRAENSVASGLLKDGFWPADFQKNVLKRFTTENTTSHKSMIALSRTLAETRFIFHSRDSALLYDTTPAFFGKSDALWKATLESQKFHKDNEDSTWDNPLRYAVALILAQKGFRINSRLAEDMFGEAMEVLLGSSSPNGLFPGQINYTTKKPELFDNPIWRDFYWHASFEIPYILWLYGRKEPFSTSSTAPARPIRRSSDTELVRSKLSRATTVSAMRKKDMNPDSQRQELRNPEMKKSMPFNTLIDQNSIIEMSDEWLYPYPDFLDFDPQNQDNTPDDIDFFDLELEKFMLEPEYALQRSQRLEALPVEQEKLLKGVILDIPKSAQKTKRKTERRTKVPSEDPCEILNVEGICEKLKGRRTAIDSKKRLIWLPNSDKHIAYIRKLAHSRSEAPFVKTFFERHLAREKYFFDEVTAVSNVWNTELQLSFYRLISGDNGSQQNVIKFPGGDKRMEQASIGFLFIGDFFDRYWTCRFLETDPKDIPNSPIYSTGDNNARTPKSFEELVQSTKLLSPTDREKRPWRQRKVLELLLFDRIIQEILDRYQEILKEISSYLVLLLATETQVEPTARGVRKVFNALFSAPMDNGRYLSFSKKWPPIQFTLQVIEDDLDGTLEKITAWMTREKDREPQRPRWTKNDERKYRSAITKLSILNNQKIRDLQHHRTDIQRLKMSLISRLESTRNELSFQSAENVRFFTYVTVVFLPLGFATAIFSMSGTPGRSELIGMISTAIVALCITVVALANARILDDKLYQPGYRLSKTAKKRIKEGFKRSTIPTEENDSTSQNSGIEPDRNVSNEENGQAIGIFSPGFIPFMRSFKAMRKEMERGNRDSALEAGIAKTSDQ
ncbi:hypothetical protein BS50DRAFT_673479 [Corynespora cassiicola Philippines]|uniref:Mg2+ transporter protein CorA-like/Zinc transport protein ZntB n=1 Tax=Corynespora cassiicola Philippines TaxID=1448308 RepID=A0A2T2NZ63_CORCC|nr:hypothetical protein BS50DRAFT_673479 [Corynespora cassiicola Philippines]